MQLIQNKWFVPILAMFLVLSVSSARVYFYIDGVLSTYAKSFYVDNADYFVYWTFHTRELQELIDSLEAKKNEMNKRQEMMENLSTRLENEKKEMAEVRSQIEAMRDSISNVIVQSKEDEMKNLKSLASTYAAMNASSVVGIINEMDDNTVVKLLSLMKSDTIGSIFEAMVNLSGQEARMRARIARLSEKLRLYKQAQTNGK